MRTVIAMILLAISLTVAHAQDNFPEVSAGHAIYIKLQPIEIQLRQFGMEDPRHGAMSGPPATMAEVGRCLIRCIDRLPKTLADAGKSPSTPSHCRSALQLARESYWLYKGEWQAPFRSAIGLLRPDLKLLGRDPDDLLRKIDGLQPEADKVADLHLAQMIVAGGQTPFRDVPPTHWAAKTVQELKDAGILVGYPDGEFK